VVFWNYPKKTEQAFLKFIVDTGKNRVSDVEADKSFDELSYHYALSKTPVSTDTTLLPSNVHSPVSFKASKDHLTLPSQDVLVKTSLSYAIAQSSTLFVFENRISETIDMTRHIPVSMEQTGSLGLDQNDVRRLVGRVYLERFNLNLHSDLLDTPEFFWDNDTYEALYTSFKAYLDVPQRVSALNKRMESE
jgi:uncharacterized Rmd1/YagE family protein